MELRSRLAAAVPVSFRRGGHQGPGETTPPGSYRTACAAPSIQLRFDPNGLVTICCKSLQPLGHISTDRLPDIWNGALRRRVADALAVDDFSVGCQRCGAEIGQEGRAVSYAAVHDAWAGHLTGDPASRAWPVRMEFNLSNACNLQCIQCDGESSSMIRLHREGRPPLPTVYDDQFFDDLRPFLPHLERIVFAGGEPFLAAENFRVWDMIADEAPHIDCLVVTNATQWSPRIEALLERLRFSFVFSLDGITKETYEAIRVGADFDEVMANVERLRAYTADIGTEASVNHCLMPQNYHEFGDLLVWGERQGLHVDVSVVRSPAHASIARLDPDEVSRIRDHFAASDDMVRPQLDINLRTWEAERARLETWASVGDDSSVSSQTIMWFRCRGTGPVDDSEAVAELAEFASDGFVHRISLDTDDIIRWCDAPVISDPSLLIGRSYQELTKAVTARFGEMAHYEVLATGDDRVDARAVFGTTPARITTVAVRDGSGWADEARILLAFDTSAHG